MSFQGKSALLKARDYAIRDVCDEDVVSYLKHAVQFVKVEDWNADFLLLLSDGCALAYWAGSDYGPAYWQLGVRA